MTDNEKRMVIERYLNAYNTFDIKGMLATTHPDVAFRNVAHDKVNITASGQDELCRLAEESRGLFTFREQKVTHFEAEGDRATILVAFLGILATDLPNGLKQGQTLKIAGRTEFVFEDGKISEITDIS